MNRILPLLILPCLLTNLAHAQVDAKTVLAYQPIQKDVEVETPDQSEIGQCKLDVERAGRGSGWALYGPQGQILRRFLDTDGDQKVDEYRYFQHGIEVYRDVDTDGNNEIDQHRWMNTAGSRWGIDENEDGRIDSWKRISAEEASREAIYALVQRNPQRLAAVMVTAQDLQAAGITGGAAKKIQENVSQAQQGMQQALRSKIIGPQTKWIRFDSSMLMPNLIPAQEGKTNKDVLVYENVMAIVDTGGESGFIQIGEMIQVGNTWKLTQVPKPLEGDRFEIADSGVLLQPTMTVAGGAPSEGISEEMQQAIDKLRDLDSKAPGADATEQEIVRYNVSRSKLLEDIAAISQTQDEKTMWMRQRLELIAAATQMGTFPNGLDELKRAEAAMSQAGDRNLQAFASFQRMLVNYNLDLQQAGAEDRPKIQEQWLESLKAFVEKFPSAPDSADAILQLAITYEFNGDENSARGWYQKLVADFPSSQPAARAKGALRRLGLKGQKLALSGPTLSGQKLDISAYRGKVVAVIFWSTWCKPCTEDLPQIQELYRVYRPEGFEVVGVNLDAPGAPVQQYIQNFKVSWPHIYEEGGLESRPAVEFGVISLPTMFLIDKAGTVVTSSASVEDFKELVPKLTKQ